MCMMHTMAWLLYIKKIKSDSYNNNKIKLGKGNHAHNTNRNNLLSCILIGICFEFILNFLFFDFQSVSPCFPCRAVNNKNYVI